LNFRVRLQLYDARVAKVDRRSDLIGGLDGGARENGPARSHVISIDRNRLLFVAAINNTHTEARVGIQITPFNFGDI